jgi:hypothetical protein
MKRVLAAIGIAAACATYALANNTAFLPGDAYFPTCIAEEDVARLTDGKPNEFSFPFANFDAWEPTFCGHAGYWQAVLPGIDGDFARRLGEAYREVRKHRPKLVEVLAEGGSTRMREVNGMQVMFYPQSFDFQKFRLGLQYNEHWVEEHRRFGHDDTFPLRLCSLVDSKDAILECWQRSKLVDGFDVNPSKPVRTPVVLNGDVKAFVLTGPIGEYHDPESRPDLIVVDKNGVGRFGFENGKWRLSERPWRPEDPDS